LAGQPTKSRNRSAGARGAPRLRPESERWNVDAYADDVLQAMKASGERGLCDCDIVDLPSAVQCLRTIVKVAAAKKPIMELPCNRRMYLNKLDQTVQDIDALLRMGGSYVGPPEGWGESDDATGLDDLSEDYDVYEYYADNVSAYRGTVEDALNETRRLLLEVKANAPKATKSRWTKLLPAVGFSLANSVMFLGMMTGLQSPVKMRIIVAAWLDLGLPAVGSEQAADSPQFREALRKYLKSLNAELLDW
jgi:hypothetical protein